MSRAPRIRPGQTSATNCAALIRPSCNGNVRKNGASFGRMSSDRQSARTHMLDRWLARGAMVVVVTLQLSLTSNFSFGRRWFAPAFELALLVPITVLTLRAELVAWRAHTTQAWESAAWFRRFNLSLARVVVFIISLSNAHSLSLLLRALLAGSTHNGRALLLDALNIWTTNVIVFALWYWGLDRGGPSIDRRTPDRPSEFIFPQTTLPADIVGSDRAPGFVDNLFLSFTTSTAFSPTDTLPLTVRMKLLMMLEGSISLLTLALVAARAVNILA